MTELTTDAKITQIIDASLIVRNPEGAFGLGDVDLIIIASVDIIGNGNTADERVFDISIPLEKVGRDPIPSVLAQRIPDNMKGIMQDPFFDGIDVEAFIIPIREHFGSMVKKAQDEHDARFRAFDEFRAFEDSLGLVD